MKSSLGYLLAPVLGYVCAQGLKFVFSTGTRSWRQWFHSGSMPSSHSAVVFGLVSVIFFHEGLTDLFAVAATLMFVTVYDALMARRSVGEQGLALVKLLGASSFAKDPLPRIALGHKPLEVAAGSGVGILVGWLVAFLITK